MSIYLCERCRQGACLSDGPSVASIASFKSPGSPMRPSPPEPYIHNRPVARVRPGGARAQVGNGRRRTLRRSGLQLDWRRLVYVKELADSSPGTRWSMLYRCQPRAPPSLSVPPRSCRFETDGAPAVACESASSRGKPGLNYRRPVGRVGFAGSVRRSVGIRGRGHATLRGTDGAPEASDAKMAKRLPDPPSLCHPSPSPCNTPSPLLN